MVRKAEFKKPRTKTKTRVQNYFSRYIKRKTNLQWQIQQDRKVLKKFKNGSDQVTPQIQPNPVTHAQEGFQNEVLHFPKWLKKGPGPRSLWQWTPIWNPFWERSDRHQRKETDNTAKKARIISGNQSGPKSGEVKRGHSNVGRTQSDKANQGHPGGEHGRKLERPKSIIKSSNKENLKGTRLNHY